MSSRRLPRVGAGEQRPFCREAACEPEREKWSEEHLETRFFFGHRPIFFGTTEKNQVVLVVMSQNIE